VTNAYDAWKAAKAGSEMDVLPGINEGLVKALTLAEAALREPAKLAVVEGWLGKHKAHLEDLIDEHDDGYRMEDIAPAIVRALEEFEASAPAITDQRSELMERVDNSLRAMKHLNYTGEHTHFEVLDDVRQVLAEVLQGRAIPMLDRFRCPSIRASDGVRCQLQLPHEGTHQRSDGSVKSSWTDGYSSNPPKSNDEPDSQHAEICGTTGTLSGVAVAVVCVRPDGHRDVHRDTAGREWV
jgi:hypothetical protein